MSHKKLVLKKSAPDEVEISFGMEFSRTFKRKDEPFSVETKYADAILRTHDEFGEYEEPKTARAAKAKTGTAKTAKTKTAAKKPAKQTGTVQPAAEPNTDPNTHAEEIAKEAIEKNSEKTETQSQAGTENK